jgi:hypothetical protein
MLCPVRAPQLSSHKELGTAHPSEQKNSNGARSLSLDVPAAPHLTWRQHSAEACFTQGVGQVSPTADPATASQPAAAAATISYTHRSIYAVVQLSWLAACSGGWL